jgi:hypothetical protein
MSPLRQARALFTRSHPAIADSRDRACRYAIEGDDRMLGYGIDPAKTGGATIQEIVNLLLLGGHMGRPGAGACPVRGHSNVQGDRTMGIWEKMADSFLASLAKFSDSIRHANMAGMLLTQSKQCTAARARCSWHGW